eukprot:14212206-Alexandrium_andersonii.AAC.1
MPRARGERSGSHRRGQSGHSEGRKGQRALPTGRGRGCQEAEAGRHKRVGGFLLACLSACCLLALVCVLVGWAICPFFHTLVVFSVGTQEHECQ